ncbi:hypothetical protein ZHAS_00014490 [Anopheles sinensis]|uniref:Uncharacterized protein n=1 Tax=Anopheles sinensis TaxID=74873 RepID=A0A084W8F6_ANOSI|nr:hypothetical protein ZHAS_00014490 [Anopheles sinensis]
MAMATCRWRYRLTIVCGLLLFRSDQPLVYANQHPPTLAPASQQHNFVDGLNGATFGFEVNVLINFRIP